ncbi:MULTISPECIES: ABC transporter ATP-binding protein [unclassified Peptostreptococcus]|uniref:ABC transporter ATP-binding protein n=1 Tax=unclassified Peptostreptococcus TaxID=2652281 RepID=UPI00050EC9FA|nr:MULTISPECIES: ABC transporter ATP-binding protein [unclassified Peptostreptococcus]KGF12668.1 ABC transporter ATP-binding protein [Peptostreptococcus sp. MV1]MBF1049425.1 ABC transporter ATP-binding protein [Peptostreptococcus sp.]
MKKLITKNLKKYYGNEKNVVKAVDGINFEVDCNEFVAIVGKSGSGKSTFLHCAAGLDKPTSGNVFINGEDIYSVNDKRLSEIRRKELGFIFQNFNLIPTLNVYDNIILPIHLDGKKENKDYIDNLIKEIGLEDQVNKFPNELSGGQQQRVAIARALSNKPSIIFADEPTGNLDSKTTYEVMALLKRIIKKYNTTLIMITHNLEIADEADRIITVSDGKIKSGQE